MVVAEGSKNFEFNTSTLLKKALKALPSHFKFEQTFVFLCFIFWGGRKSLGVDTASVGYIAALFQSAIRELHSNLSFFVFFTLNWSSSPIY